MLNFLKKILGSKNDRDIKRMQQVVAKINALEAELDLLDQTELAKQTPILKERLAKGESLDSILPHAFALVREMSQRVLGMRHFDVQLMGGMALHQGKVAEMRTGEGKTLVATLAVYLNALSGKGVHVVTVNDYLASRDADWMRPLYEALGLTVGVILSGQDTDEKAKAYAADITYGTNNEFGFDYLRDNMAFVPEDKVQRPLHFALVDEVDSILIDEARTPLIISGAAENNSVIYQKISKLVPSLERFEGELDPKNTEQEVNQHFVLDEKNRTVELTEVGYSFVEQNLIKMELLAEGDSLYSPSNLQLLHHVIAGLKAQHLFVRDKDYIIQDKEIVIVDEHTGRIMPGRRWSEGLHQAVEAKEGVEIQQESQTLASTTFQNYFRLYEKLSGMTGTADTEAFELREIYSLDVIVIPTNKPISRIDSNDLVFLNIAAKYQAIVKEILEVQKQKRPILVGTASVESSELLSDLLTRKGIEHNVLNAKHHSQEAQIIEDAGKAGSVTIATNMAGRGTDIVLGGKLKDDTEASKAEWQKRHDAVLEAGGLHIIGTERHESRRIDNQLRGRAGRQGDLGSSRFFLSLEDDLMRIFASDRVRQMMQMLGMENGEAIEHKMVNNAIEKAQRKVEGRNFDIRKSLLEYDNVANDQRRVIYEQRDELMVAEDIAERVEAVREEVLDNAISVFIPPMGMAEQWDVAGLKQNIAVEFNLKLPLQEWLDEDKNLHEELLREKIQLAVLESYQSKEKLVGAETLRLFEKQVMLQVLDNLWKEHLQAMDQLRQGIHLRGYAQKNPKQEYQREAFNLFQNLLDNFKYEVVRVLTHVEVNDPEDVANMEQQRREQSAEQNMQYQHEQTSSVRDETDQPFLRDTPKVGRNEPCPCGSGKKYKQCHGKLV